jgi:hypothetical protein
MIARRRLPHRQAAPVETLTVYQGRHFCGSISLRAGKWRAIDDDGRPVGAFASRLEAYANVLRKAGET